MQLSSEVLRKIFTLLRIPNARPLTLLSGLFFYLRDENKLNNNQVIAELLGKFTAFVVARAIQGEVGNALKRFFVKGDWGILDKTPENFFDNCELQKATVEMLFRNFASSRNKTFTKQAVSSYWFFQFDNQELPPPKDKFSIEHIVAKDSENFKKFNNPDLLESLGNMAFLENRINTRANNLGFDSKKVCYVGFTDKGKHSPGTVNRELQHLAQTYNDFTETDIRNRNEKMLDTVLNLLGKYNLLKDR